MAVRDFGHEYHANYYGAFVFDRRRQQCRGGVPPARVTRGGLVRPAIRQREGAGIAASRFGTSSPVLESFSGIGTDDAVRREGHPGEPAVVEDEARATVPVVLSGFGSLSGPFALVVLLLVVGRGHGPGARIVIDKRFAPCGCRSCCGVPAQAMTCSLVMPI